MKTGKRIKELRLKKGLTQEELAHRTEVSARTIQRIENGEVDPRAYTLQMIAKALEVDYDLFIELETPDTPCMVQTNHNVLALMHVSGLLPLLFPAIFIWKRHKNKTKDISKHFRAVMSLQLCILIILLISLLIYWKTNQALPLFGILLAGALVSIQNGIMVMNGAPFINPFVKN